MFVIQSIVFISISTIQSWIDLEGKVGKNERSRLLINMSKCIDDNPIGVYIFRFFVLSEKSY